MISALWCLKLGLNMPAAYVADNQLFLFNEIFQGFVFVEICSRIRSKAYFIFRNDRFYFIENEYFESNFVITNNVTTVAFPIRSTLCLR